MAGRWLPDTSALLALRDNETGAERVAELLQRSQARQGSCLVCFMSRMELLCRVWKDEGERGGGHQGHPSPLRGRCLDRRRR